MCSLNDVKGLESSLLPMSSMDSTQLSRCSSPLLLNSQLSSHSLPFRTLRLMKMNRMNQMKMIKFLIPLLLSPTQVLDSSLPVFPSPTLSGPPAGHHILCKPSTPRLKVSQLQQPLSRHRSSMWMVRFRQSTCRLHQELLQMFV